MMQNGVDKSEALSVGQVPFINSQLVFTNMGSIDALVLVDFRLSAETPLTFSWTTVAPFTNMV